MTGQTVRMMHNHDIARRLSRLADLLEIEGANPFRIRAYRTAARIVSDLPQEVTTMLNEGADLTALPGIGRDLAAKITELATTGQLELLRQVEARVPDQLADLMALPGLGPKRVRRLHEDLGIRTLDQLEAAARAGRVRALPGFGRQTEQMILREVRRVVAAQKRTLLSEAEAVAEALKRYLATAPGVRQVTVAGSYRRRKETVGDLDILATARNGARVVHHFTAYKDIDHILSRGRTRSTVILRSGLQVDLRVVSEASYGAALHYFTGSKAHNIALRKMAVARGLKINEYGVFRGRKRLAGHTEQDVYAQMGLAYIEPELRENRGEIEAACNGTLPHLITLNDIRGDLHVHTDWSDGRAALEEMALAARAKGYAYLAISDHSRHVTVAHGLDAKRLGRQIDAIDALNEKLKGFRLLKSCEVDILEDGRLDLDDTILRRLDFTVCSVHYKFSLSRNKQTERILRAMDHPCFTILGHPTGRLINRRPPYDIDIERIMAAAAERGCLLELNGHPDRLDLTDIHCKMAKDMGVKLALSTDAHSVHGLDMMRFAVGQARRGWLEPGDVVNTLPWKSLKRLLKRN